MPARIEQIGTPQQVYDQPDTSFVASFLGKANILPATVASVSGGFARLTMPGGELLDVPAGDGLRGSEAVRLVIRPQRLGVAARRGPITNGLAGCIVSAAYLGGSASYEVDLGWHVLRAVVPLAGSLLVEGTPVSVTVDSQGCVLLDRESGFRLR